MNQNKLKSRLKKDRPMTSVTLRMPVDVVEDLKTLAPVMGFVGYQPLLRYYIGQSLRKDLSLLENPKREKLINSLKKHGLPEKEIGEVLQEVGELNNFEEAF